MTEGSRRNGTEDRLTTSLSGLAASGAVRPAELLGKSCFVIMPFGTKDGPGGKIDFDWIFKELIEPAARAAGVEAKREDSQPESGLIHQRMIDHILRADIVIADTTIRNANVFYELGVRHTARPSGTVIIRRRSGDDVPFDIQGMSYIEYVNDPSDPDFKPRRQAISTAITASLSTRRTDSLVHSLIPGLNVSRRAEVIPERRKSEAVLRIAPQNSHSHVSAAPGVAPLFPTIAGVQAPDSASFTKYLGVITGDLTYIEDVDIWVNPESTRMEMGRVHDDSVSATIRYYGAKRGVRGQVISDRIGEELLRRIESHPGRDNRRNAIVEAATVVRTRAGELRQLNKVRRIFHVACQHGEPGKGYVTVRSYEDCVKRVLEAADDYNDRLIRRVLDRTSKTFGLKRGRKLRSVLFPLFGTRSADRDAKDVATRLVQAAKTYFETWPDSSIEKVYFLAYTDEDRELCETAFKRLNLDLLPPLKSTNGSGL